MPNESNHFICQILLPTRKEKVLIFSGRVIAKTQTLFDFQILSISYFFEKFCGHLTSIFNYIAFCCGVLRIFSTLYIYLDWLHCVKSFQIRIFFRSEYRKIRTRKTPYLVSFHAELVLPIVSRMEYFPIVSNSFQFI